MILASAVHVPFTFLRCSKETTTAAAGASPPAFSSSSEAEVWAATDDEILLPFRKRPIVGAGFAVAAAPKN